MSAPLTVPAPLAITPHDQYVISFGKSGAVGVFTAPEPLPLRRGQLAVIQTPRGLEIGTVLCPASLLQARLLGATSAGTLLRPVTLEDELRLDELIVLTQSIFDTGLAWAQRDGLTLQILDVELLLDGQQAIVQFVGPETDLEPFAETLQTHFGLTIRLENLAAPHEHEEEHEHRCDKPDCGRGGEGGCSTCSTGGGCSSCGSSKVDMRQYFAHLRTKMEAQHRIPLA